jgi:pimeloyl-ACP methyl ester carboxylesterase
MIIVMITMLPGLMLYPFGCCYLLIVHQTILVAAFLSPSAAPHRSTSFHPSTMYAVFHRLGDKAALAANAGRVTGIDSPSTTATSITIESYEYDGWNLTYRYKPACAGREIDPPLLLIHPVGIGLSSWFWEPFMEAWEGPALYAPNLIGCGVSEGGDAWDPDQRGLFIPLGWVRGCEALMDHAHNGIGDVMNVNQQRQYAQQFSTFVSPTALFRNLVSRGTPRPRLTTWTVVTQGGLAPIGVLLASRNPTRVGNLVMASPPTWHDITTAVPEVELTRNYNFLRSPLWGNLAFRLLESRAAIEFFSNQFLFSNPCDATWLDKAENEFGIPARPPVQVFNAGFCMNQGLEPELTTLVQPTLIVQGVDDKRQRHEYVVKLKNCQTETLPGKNVVPWEYPEEFAKLLATAV